MAVLSSSDVKTIAITSAVAAAAGAVASAAVAGIIAYWVQKRTEQKAEDTAIDAAELTVADMMASAAKGGASGFGAAGPYRAVQAPGLPYHAVARLQAEAGHCAAARATLRRGCEAGEIESCYMNLNPPAPWGPCGPRNVPPGVII